MSDKRNISSCARCNRDIKVIVERCTACKMDFHPCCTKFHKILDENNINVKCQGPFEKFNIQVSTNINNNNKRKSINSPKINPNKSTDVIINNSDHNRVTNSDDIIVIKEIDKRLEDKMSKLKEFIRDIIKNELLEVTKSLEDVIHEEITKNIEDVKDEIKKFLPRSENHVNETKHSRDSKSMQKISKKIPESIVVKPLTSQDPAKTLEELQTNIDVCELGVDVNKVINRPNGEVVIEMEKETDKVIIINEIKQKFGDTYQVTEKIKKMPKIKIVGVDNDLISTDNETIVKNLIKQNNIESTQLEVTSTKIIKKYKTKYNTGTIIMETSSKMHKLIMEKNTVKYGWKNYKFYNYVSITRCFKCWGYKHLAKNCNKQEICRICAENHEEKECNSQQKKCINCLEYVNKYKPTEWKCDHTATDNKCGIFIKLLDKEERLIHTNDK